MPFCRNDTHVSSCDCHDKRQATNPVIRRQDFSNRIPLFINSFNEIPLFIELYRILKLSIVNASLWIIHNILNRLNLEMLERIARMLHALYDIE